MYIVYCGQKLIHLITWILRQQFLHHNVLCLFMNLVLFYVNSNSCLNFMQIFKKCMGWELYLFGNSKYIMLLQYMLYNIVHTHDMQQLAIHISRFLCLVDFLLKENQKRRPRESALYSQHIGLKMMYCIMGFFSLNGDNGVKWPSRVSVNMDFPMFTWTAA